MGRYERKAGRREGENRRRGEGGAESLLAFLTITIIGQVSEPGPRRHMTGGKLLSKVPRYVYLNTERGRGESKETGRREGRKGGSGEGKGGRETPCSSMDFNSKVKEEKE